MTDANHTCSTDASHGAATLRISADVPGTDSRMVQWVCPGCFFDTTEALRELGATRIIAADEHNEQRILAALAIVASGKTLPR